jgi:(5-formylfuran-3-yl)methyl phosphate synthase
MRLLVSVAGPLDARAALAGGADVIDAKDPGGGGLGPVGADALAAIRRVVGVARPLSAALGDARATAAIESATRAAARVGLAFVKVGFAGVARAARALRLAAAARDGAGPGTGLVLVAYADWRRVASPAPARLVAVAAQLGAAGVLLDTAYKDTPLFALASPDAVGAWVDAVHAAGLFAALAGSLSGDDFATARALGADLVGVRGAACRGGRRGPVSAARVKALRALIGPTPGVPVGVLS